MVQPALRMLTVCAILLAASAPSQAAPSQAAPSHAGELTVDSFLTTWCRSCHSGSEPAGQFILPSEDVLKLPDNLDAWEKVVRRLQNNDMPPLGEPRPDPAEAQITLKFLTSHLDEYARSSPRPGRTESLRRLTRTEYQNAVRDLLGVNVDVTTLLPADESSHGFDNITVTGLSPLLLNRYVTAAEKISRFALGRPEPSPSVATYRIRGDVTQDGHHVEGLPFGTRGGIRIDRDFPRSGEYEIQVRLMRDRNDEIEGLSGRHLLDVLVDRRRVQRFEIQRPADGGDDHQVDAALIARLTIDAGHHQIGVTFAENGNSLIESDRQPLNVHFNYYRHPRLGPAVHEVMITGPIGESSAGQSESRQRILTRIPANPNKPTDPNEFDDCAREILLPLLHRAYRRPVSDNDLQTALHLFRAGVAEEQDFEAGIERAIAGILVNPQFLFRIERDLPAQQNVAPVSDVELASRLSFFLWSSLPDDELLQLAEAGHLSKPDVLAQQTRRMLADSRAESLVTNFADQWLYLRNLGAVTPDARLFPDFDQNLRDAFRRETELLFTEMLREDRSVLTLLNSDHAWLNERLARHYGISQVSGDHFRKVTLQPEQHRGGILRHGSILSVTSYATRTSPVLRGKWILENILGSPPPPPPENVPPLQDNTVSASLPLRERLAAHRENQSCAACHNRIDPIGFSLENYDAVGRWRESELNLPIDATGGLPDGSQFEGVSGLEHALLQHPELFVRTVTEKLLVYALGRGLNPEDGVAVRRIVVEASNADLRPAGTPSEPYQFSSVILGIVHSPPFRMRERAPQTDLQN